MSTATIEGLIGPSYGADNTTQQIRMGRDAPLITGDLHGRYYENASRGQTFTAATASAGIAHGSALTATPAFAILNPAGSGRNISILKTFWGYVSGTLGSGSLWYTQGANPGSLPAETAAAFRSATLLSGAKAAAGDVALAYSGISLTNTPVLVRPSAFTLSAYAGAANIIVPLVEEIAGEIIVQPGAFFAIEGIGTAGTTPLIVIGCTYEIVVP